MTSTSDLVSGSAGDLPRKQNEETKTFKTMTFGEKISFVREVVTVEPLLCCYVMASVLAAPALSNLEFEKACRVNEAYNDTVCDAILNGQHENYTEQNTRLQLLISAMHSWQQPLQTIMPLILVLFLGSYSDRHKIRKPFLLLPIIGEFFAVTGCILCVIFMREWPLEAQGIAQTVVPSFFGGQTMITMAVFAYIADVSTLEMRTLRIGIVQVSLNICYPVVTSFSGILFQLIGYTWILVIVAVLYAFAVIYGILWIKEPKTPVNINKKGLLQDMFDPRHALETFSLLTSKKEGRNRRSIILVLLIHFMSSAVVVGEFSLFWLFTQSSLQWTIVEFSYFLTFNTVLHLVGNIVSLPILTNVLKINDLLITVLSFLDKIIANFIYIFAKTTVALCVGTAISIITGISTIAIRSIATKIVPEDDLGKAQSLFAIFESIAPAISIPVYNTVIYTPTIDTFPSAFFLVGIVLFALGIVVLMWMHFKQERKTARNKLMGIENDHNNIKTISMTDMQTTHM